MTEARPEPIPFFGELGGINAVFVTGSAWSARREEILAGYAGSFTLGMGQFCTKPGIVFVPQSGETKSFLDELKSLVEQAQPYTLLTGGIAREYEELTPGKKSDGLLMDLIASDLE